MGLSISLLLLMVLYNTSISKVENERRRIGILQALGVTSKQYKQFYFFTGLAYGLIALLFANIIFFIIVLYFGLAFGGPLGSAIENVLWLYPFKVHITIAIVFLLLAVITTYLPIRKTIKQAPIYNINNNQR
jgi:ABC-type antimicrobial peptide transport system permease subunit